MRDALSVCSTSMGLAQRLAAPSHSAYIHKPQKGEIFMHIVILGIVVETVLGLREIVRQAFIWYKRSAEQGNPQGQYSLAKCYESGEPDPKRMMELFRAAAEQGHELAGEYLGLYHSDLHDRISYILCAGKMLD